MLDIKICEVGVVKVKTTNNSILGKHGSVKKESDRKENTDTKSTLRN